MGDHDRPYGRRPIGNNNEARQAQATKEMWMAHEIEKTGLCDTTKTV